MFKGQTDQNVAAKEADNSVQAIQPDILDGYMTLAELAVSTGRSERTVYRWTQQPNGLPTLKLGAQRLVKVETARRWLESLEKPSPPDRPSCRRGSAPPSPIGAG